MISACKEAGTDIPGEFSSANSLFCLHSAWCGQVLVQVDTGFFLLRGVVRNVHIHRANLTALPAACALCSVALHAEKGKTTHGYQKDGDKGEGVCKYSTPKPAEKESFAALWDLPGKKVQHHRRPAGPVAPAPSKEKGTEDLRSRAVDRRGLDLHVFAAENPKGNEHAAAHRELHNAAFHGVLPDQEHKPKSTADVGKIEKLPFSLRNLPSSTSHGCNTIVIYT